ncbi:hypothetical protein AG1IA_08577 [Rhizoctonia solani AG-1 IA]|uniref:Uncharacterized protein n=1 Tax=Thanatephorus cucumeris (strain AG1-IA) TaxID=983506 RepID=L8WKQ7_THACA|nr:hypothetical protein AG1IA_08577 [Rhizoctonia solani AG-1 IA]
MRCQSWRPSCLCLIRLNHSLIFVTCTDRYLDPSHPVKRAECSCTVPVSF